MVSELQTLGLQVRRRRFGRSWMSSRRTAFVQVLEAEIGKVIVGQKGMAIERILIGLLTGGHVLLEGVPGLAKRSQSNRRPNDSATLPDQFTPDLHPPTSSAPRYSIRRRANSSRTEGRSSRTSSWLTDQPRTGEGQSISLLEAMQERQVTSDTTFKLPRPFLVLATQNPHRAGKGRIHCRKRNRPLHAPCQESDINTPKAYSRRAGSAQTTKSSRSLTCSASSARVQWFGVHSDEKVKDYILDIIVGDARPKAAGIPDLAPLIGSALYALRSRSARRRVRTRS